MMDPHDSLDRLFRAARHAPERAVELPAGFEMRVLAAWSRAAASQEEAAWALSLVRRAILIASAAALLSLAFSYQSAGESSLNELAQADMEITASLLP